ncbi:MAG: class I SAM-dependent methyltransferase [Acidobacteriia bacterium]|nr:class I SAM-dependent methyltransferase [Terriglobia bacterium]
MTGMSWRAVRWGRLQSLAERAVRRRLHHLKHGGLTIVGSDGADSYGTAADVRADVTVHCPLFWTDVAFGGTLGAAESYILGRWSADDLTALCRIFARNIALTDGMERGWARAASQAARILHALRRNTRRGALANIEAHYDLGNDFFRLVLDETMSYSCAVFGSPGESLESASLRKVDLACRKLDLVPSDHLLEIGTGWGALAIHAATRYGCRVTTTTVSKEQFLVATQRVREAGLADRVEVILRDYRDLSGRYDKIVSVEMIEAVGHEFLPGYFAKCSRLLADDGLMLLQAILMAEHRYESYRRSADFIQRYVFPGSCLLSMAAIGRAVAAGTDMRMIHLEDLAPHYPETLRRWRGNFRARRAAIRALGHSQEFVRLWEFYLSYCEAGFEERLIGNVQLLLAKPGNRRPPITAEVRLA